MDRVLRIVGDARSEIANQLPSESGFEIKDAVNAALYMIGVVAVIMVIYAGILYITAAGDAGKLAKAKTAIVWAVVGLVVVILSYAIVNFVIGAF